ncbi:uncharacterized protein LJ206_012485 isoform 1-T1 [Theristicus caerulescens]
MWQHFEFTSHHSRPLVFSSANPDESEVLKRDKIQGKSVLDQESMYERRKPNSTQKTAIQGNFLPLQGELVVGSHICATQPKSTTLQQKLTMDPTVRHFSSMRPHGVRCEVRFQKS